MRTLRTLAVNGFVPAVASTVFSDGQTARVGQSLLDKAKLWVARALQLDRQHGEDKFKKGELEVAMSELLMRHNIAGFVGAKAIAENLPDDRPDGLVPATQFVRMLLVREFGHKWLKDDKVRR
jgi:hypothetical protein